MNPTKIDMNIFGSVTNTSNAANDIPSLTGNESKQELLDYIVVSLTRCLTRSIAFKGEYPLDKLLKGIE